MANYKIIFKASITKDLHQIPDKDVQRILQRIDQLANDPRPPAAKKLTGKEKYRIRQGNYRIVYTVEDKIVTVTIIKVGHRRAVYDS